MIIQDNVDILTDPLSVFYNGCYNQGVFPEQMKIAKIIPKYKKGMITDLKNYLLELLPVCLLSVLAKILHHESSFAVHLERNKILRERQFGYNTNKGNKDCACRCCSVLT